MLAAHRIDGDTGLTTVRLAELTADNVHAACRVEVRPDQQKFVAPVAPGEQGRGYGSFAVGQVAEEARRRGFSRITVLCVPGEGGPEGFYLRQGFRPTGEEMGGEIVSELILQPPAAGLSDVRVGILAHRQQALPQCRRAAAAASYSPHDGR